MKDREEQIRNIFKDVDERQRMLAEKLIGEMLYLEQQLDDLKKLPFIKVNPNDVTQQKATPAAKQYKDLSQSYMHAVKILCSLLTREEGTEYDPVQAFLEMRKHG